MGSGYVGMSLALLLSRNNAIKVLDIDPARIEKINSGKSTIADDDIDNLLAKKSTNIIATLDSKYAYSEADFIIICTPTNYDPEINYFDTSSVDNVIEEIFSLNKEALVVIKSTIPIGYTSSMQMKYDSSRIIFSPEFLREGSALRDNLNPSRIIIGSKSELAKKFGSLLSKSATKKDIDILFTSSSDAEAIKLFANTYLAMRVSFFNEVDTFAIAKNLDARSIIDGMSLDERIGKNYNNPSFGYGGYCLPKDTKQLLANFDQIPQNLIEAIVLSNKTRKEFIANEIIKKSPRTVGIYRLIMKEGSSNFRSSAILDVIEIIKESGIKVIIYEPTLHKSIYNGLEIKKNLQDFKSLSDIIIANRFSKSLEDVQDKLYTRDLFNEN